MIEMASKPGCAHMARDESGGDLLTAQVVPGMEVARAWLRLWCGTWGSAGINHRGVAKEGVVR